MNPLVVEGAGMHPFGRFEDKPAVAMGAEALVEALTDAELCWSDIDLLVCAHMYAKTGAGHRIAALLGQTGIPILNVENACSSGGAAVLAARGALATGQYRRVAVVGIEKMPRGFMDMDYFDPWRREIGHAVNPAQFAFAIRRHMHEHGTTERQLALVAEKNHAHSVHNPKAMYQKPISAEEVLGESARGRPAAAADALHTERGRRGRRAERSSPPVPARCRSSVRDSAPPAAHRRWASTCRPTPRSRPTSR